MSIPRQGVRSKTGSASGNISKVLLRSTNLHVDPDDDTPATPEPTKPAKPAKPKRRPPKWGPEVLPASLEDGYDADDDEDEFTQALDAYFAHMYGDGAEGEDDWDDQVGYVDVSKLRLRRLAFPPPHVADVTRRGSGLAGLIVTDWAMEVVTDAERSADSVRKVLCYMAYWSMPKADGKPRAGKSFRGVRHGVWWFATGATRIGRVFGLSAGRVAGAIDRLIHLGLVERLPGTAAVRGAEVVLDDDAIFARIRWEVVAHLWAKSPFFRL
jgi:hypothetical protein